MVDIRALIEKQRAEFDEGSEVSLAMVQLAGELVEVEVRRADGAAWQDLTATHPPRPDTEDYRVGCNLATLPAAYPVSRLRVAGEDIDADTWGDLYESLDASSRNVVGAIMWKVNALDPTAALIALGKAAAGGSLESPANRASRRAASKGGSQRK